MQFACHGYLLEKTLTISSFLANSVRVQKQKSIDVVVKSLI